MRVDIRSYEAADEQAWPRCRVLAFLDSAYHDDVLTRRLPHAGPAIDLVAEVEGQLVAILAVEYERQSGALALGTAEGRPPGRGAVVHTLGVHPDFRRRGIASRLLASALGSLSQAGVSFLEAWTRDDESACRWYEAHGFALAHAYMHVYADGPKEIAEMTSSSTAGLVPSKAFAHYEGDREDWVRSTFRRVHECRLCRRSV